MAEAEPAIRQSRGSETIADSTFAKVISSVGKPTGGGIPGKSPLAKNYVVQRIATLEDRLNTVKKQQLALLGELRDSAGTQIDRYSRIVQMTGLNVDQVAQQIGSRPYSGKGGPLISEVRAAKIDGVTDEFDRQFADIAESYGRLDALTVAVSRMPLVTPVHHGQYRSTSGYGYRVDPFTGRVAFHSGADMAGEFGTPVLATAPGRVIAAERRGPYGLMVEIDHGRGVRTRFGHLQNAFVKAGDQVAFRQKIATMGSSGRSTGPHLHYEIWFNDVPRDPTKFFDAGRNVFKG
jgi:murein DD-endopeptidase MepM/ murein hydrolase activator NlpD